jgi:hypothetical protein
VVELGTGPEEFEAMIPEQELGLIAGPQGGFHFVVHARVQGLDPGIVNQPVTTPRTFFSVFDEAGNQISWPDTPPYRLAYESRPDGWWQLPSGKVCLILNEVVPDIYGTRVRIRVEVIDRTDRVDTDERWVLVYDACKRNPDLCF